MLLKHQLDHGDKFGFVTALEFLFEMVSFFRHTRFSHFQRIVDAIAGGAGRNTLERALDPLFDRNFETLVSPLIPRLQPALIDTMKGILKTSERPLAIERNG